MMEKPVPEELFGVLPPVTDTPTMNNIRVIPGAKHAPMLLFINNIVVVPLLVQLNTVKPPAPQNVLLLKKPVSLVRPFLILVLLPRPATPARKNVTQRVV